MKKVLLFLFIGLLFVSCSSDDSGPSLSNTPQAKVAYDNSNYGVYKGVFVGSTGNVYININNDGKISATLIIDGKKYEFITEDTVNEGEITGITFTSGSMSFVFEVEDDGSFPMVSSINIPGHPDAQISIIKEDSEHLVRCYQGTYSGTSSGVLNFVTYENEMEGVAKSNEEGSLPAELEGIITNGVVVGTVDEGNASFTGNVGENSASGTWESLDGGHGNWSGTRKL